MTPLFEMPEIDRNPTAFAFVVGKGFQLLGTPRIPSPPVGAAEACEPASDAEYGSWHRLIPPNQVDGTYIRVRWNSELKCWVPPLESGGRRIAFSSKYLAAAGWVYGEAE
jgi:hypothetical protein